MTQKKEDNELVQVKEKMKGMEAMLASTKVTTDEELNSVADKIKVIKTLCKIIEAKKDKYTEPAKMIIAEARETYDPMIKECKNAEIVLKERAGAYMMAKEAEQRKAQEKIAAKVESGYMKPETAASKLEAMPEAPKTVSTDKGSTLRMAKRKVAVISNPSMIPDEYWIVDEVRVRKDALARDAANLSPIPGVDIVEQASLSSM